MLLFVPAIALRFLPPSLAPFALLLMVVGIILLVAGFLTVPGSMRDILRPKV